MGGWVSVHICRGIQMAIPEGGRLFLSTTTTILTLLLKVRHPRKCDAYLNTKFVVLNLYRGLHLVLHFGIELVPRPAFGIQLVPRPAFGIEHVPRPAFGIELVPRPAFLVLNLYRGLNLVLNM